MSNNFIPNKIQLKNIIDININKNLYILLTYYFSLLNKKFKFKINLVYINKNQIYILQHIRRLKIKIYK